MTSGLFFTLLVCLSGGLWIGADAVRCGGNRGGCPHGWSIYGNRCFLFIRSEASWLSSERYCNSAGGHLASFHSYGELSFLRGLVYRHTRRFPKTWVGGNDRASEGCWKWTDGSAFNYSHWHRGEPNNVAGREHCMEINFDGNYTNDEKCWIGRPFICSRRR